jgi:hypothetical protein
MSAVKRSQSRILTLDEFFHGYEDSHLLFDVILERLDSIGAYELRVTKSQIAFRHRKDFAWAWIPAKYLRGKTAPLVLSLSLPQRNSSPRWKEIVEPYPGRFMHHLELFYAQDIDDEVRAWTWEAWLNAS